MTYLLRLECMGKYMGKYMGNNMRKYMGKHKHNNLIIDTNYPRNNHPNVNLNLLSLHCRKYSSTINNNNSINKNNNIYKNNMEDEIYVSKNKNAELNQTDENNNINSNKNKNKELEVKMTNKRIKSSLRRVVSSNKSENKQNFNFNNSNNKNINIRPCTTITTCESYDLPTVVEILHTKGHLSASVFLLNEVVHLSYPIANGEKSDVFVFSSGSVTAWGMREGELENFVKEITSAENHHYSEAESEDIDYVETLHTGKFRMKGDIIELSEDSSDKKLLIKAAISSGIARSTKLAVLEASLEKYIDSMKEITESLAYGRKLKISNKSVMQKAGELLRLRGALNLYSELLGTPDLYWSEPVLEFAYELTEKNLDIAPRIVILNRKMDYASEVVETLKTLFSERTSVHLEQFIILLILIEVMFEIGHYIENKMEKEAMREKENS